MGLKDPNDERRHCQIVTKENRWFLADLDSTNGTYLNGKKIRTRDGTRLK
ncbi:MAG: FHA domain-containing protein [Bdellovibrionaceae bacterium]|nr:FHA domain-containing protein [Pseudobdellovibrionaceae bacterium]